MNILILIATMIIHSPNQPMPTIVDTNGNVSQIHSPNTPMPTTITVRRRRSYDPDVSSISSMGFGMASKSSPSDDPKRCQITKKKCNRCNGRWQLKQNCKKCNYTGTIIIKKYLNPKNGKFELSKDLLNK